MKRIEALPNTPFAFPQAPQASHTPQATISMAVLGLLRLELSAMYAASETWRTRCEAAEAAIAKHQQQAVRRELLNAVTIREISAKDAVWTKTEAPKLTLIERVWLWLNGER